VSKVREILEKNNLLETRWGKRILAMEKRGRPTKTEEADAMNWQTCACGQQDARIWRHNDGRPMDNMLRRLGEIFYINVCEHQPYSAAITLVNIERRAAEVLAKLE
jgi:hypothetical protein